MRSSKRPLGCSLALNAILLIVLASLYAKFRDKQMSWEMEGPHWATYAGTMQCIADHDEAGLRRFLHLTMVTNGQGELAFTGDREGGTEVWSWPIYPTMGAASRASNRAFVDAYNRRMRNFIAEDTTRPR